MAEVFDRITVEPGKCGGRPCIRGMRIRVTDILDMLAGGMTTEEILADYPYLEREDIEAAVTEPGYLSSIGTSVVPSFLVLTRAEWQERERKRAPIWRTITRDGVAVR